MKFSIRTARWLGSDTEFVIHGRRYEVTKIETSGDTADSKAYEFICEDGTADRAMSHLFGPISTEYPWLDWLFGRNVLKLEVAYLHGSLALMRQKDEEFKSACFAEIADLRDANSRLLETEACLNKEIKAIGIERDFYKDLSGSLKNNRPKLKRVLVPVRSTKKSKVKRKKRGK